MKSLLVAVFAALALPAAAAAHATLVRTSPADGAVLAQPPVAVRVVFDDTVTRGPGIAAILNGGGSVLAGAAAHVDGGRTLVIPLRRGLADGDYSVRWAIVSDDGHLESGVVAFAVGLGRPAPTAALGAAATGPQPPDVIARWLFLAGLLAAVGISAFALLTRADDEPVALVLASSAVLAALGAADESHRIGLHTRAGAAFVAGSAFAVVVALVAASALLERRALRPALWLALPLVAVPTAAGHALDRGLPRINVAADLLHVAGAALWIGALLGLVVTGRRSFRAAFAGVGLLGVTGVVRASYELVHVAQLWDTGYGRSLLVKTGVLVVALAAGVWRRPRGELLIVGGLLVAVAVLVLQRPGRNAPVAAASAAIPAIPTVRQPNPPRPPADAIVVAREAGPYGVALEAEPRRLTVVVLSPAGGGASGLPVTIDGEATRACGHGCYRLDRAHDTRVDVTVAGLAARFTVPRHAPDAQTAVQRLQRAYRRLTSVEYRERLASDATTAISTRWVLQAPNRLSYAIRDGAQAIVVGGRRWDRAGAGARWVESSQTPLPQPTPPWTSATNAHRVGKGLITFADPTIPAFFTLGVGGEGRLRVLHMVAAAHFMTDRYLSFDSSPPIRPPR